MSANHKLVMQAKGLVKRYGHVTALDGTDFELRAGEILAVIGDNGAGKSSLIKALSGATIPDEGEILLDGKLIHFKSPMDARRAGIETVYQDLAVAAAMSISENLFLGRELRRPGFLGNWLRMLDKKKMLEQSIARMQELKVGIRSMTQPVETLSGGQRQCVAVGRAAAFAQHVVIMDEPTAALGVKEGNMVLELIRRVRDRGLPVVLISHNMPHVFEVADRIHVARLGKRAAVLNPKKISMSDTVAVMTGVFRTFSSVSMYSGEYWIASGTIVLSACLTPTTLSPPIANRTVDMASSTVTPCAPMRSRSSCESTK